ncbi:MAG: hypothetical protein QOF03_472 [Alphaproteobacteria bacterium]|nr:hypothetical protein [Alphaproteobacteria bacterium]
MTLRARRITFFVGFLTLLLLTLRSPRPSDLSELFTVLRMTIGVSDPTRMIFVKNIQDARKACDCRQDCHVVIERSPPVEIARLTAVRSSGGQCELISYRVTKADADAADRNGIRGVAFALFRMKSQDIIRRYAPATFLHDRDAERESIAYCVFAPRRGPGNEVRIISLQFAFLRGELQSFTIQLLDRCPADPFPSLV